MTDMQFVKFEQWHLYGIEIRHPEAEYIEVAKLTDEANIALATVMCGGLPVTVVGLAMIRPDVYEVFVIPTKNPPTKPIAYVKQMRSWLRWIVDTYKPARIQTAVLPDVYESKWITTLGFTQETAVPMVNYGGFGHNYHMWAYKL
jgi:hypothetical protein